MPAQQEISETFVGLRLERWLKDGIQECAAKQHRSTSNWVRIALEKAVTEELEKKR